MTWYMAPVGTPEPSHNVERGRFNKAWPNDWTILPDDPQVTITEHYRNMWFISLLRVRTELHSFALGWESFDNKTRLIFSTCSQHSHQTVLAVGSFTRYDAGQLQSERSAGVSVDVYFSKRGCLR